jgi:hypothetical protein
MTLTIVPEILIPQLYLHFPSCVGKWSRVKYLLYLFHMYWVYIVLYWVTVHCQIKVQWTKKINMHAYEMSYKCQLYLTHTVAT